MTTLTPGESVPFERRKRGRPRSAAVEQAIIAATIAIITETSVREASMDAVAQRAGVSKATLYKWWPSKLHLSLDALLHLGKSNAPVPDTGSAMEDFIINLKGIGRFYTDPVAGPCMMQLWGECLNAPDMLAVYRDRFLRRRREGLHVIYERGVARGEIDGRYGVELVLDMIYGPTIFRLLTGNGPVNDDEAELIVRSVFAGLAPG